MAGTKAELAAMKTGADTLDDLGAQMKATLSQLRGDVEATQGVWAGAAQVAFLGVMARWDESAAKVNTALVDISTMLSGNTASYRAQEEESTSTITALSL
ncbi:WXG100 family type VII secretion target [Tsukamurella sp. M9C]|uniref:WXG100 family type VII secretion target n=1 Tax=unclassified Tsukamurella TaxID=2633480 RepID=UPI001CC9414F|nr:WXG100 family type VII secretion target [Tsukamurella sp. M9C]MCA0158318.1 WXG100 family type VII secretion target [Tsukamurella sp. M9C]